MTATLSSVSRLRTRVEDEDSGIGKSKEKAKGSLEGRLEASQGDAAGATRSLWLQRWEEDSSPDRESVLTRGPAGGGVWSWLREACLWDPLCRNISAQLADVKAHVWVCTQPAESICW